MQFPALPGLRKQNFQITDRSTAVKSPSSKLKQAPSKPPKRVAGKLSNVLGGFGATRAVACCRSKFLFDSNPVLFFAEIPLTKLKPRSANKLRRELIGIGVRACVVSVDGSSVVVMVWPAADDAITEFVEAATPEYPSHLDFFKAPPAKHKPDARATKDIRNRSDPNANDREKKLLREVSALRRQVEQLQQSRSALGAIEKLGLDDQRLKSMLALLHPDKHGGSDAANDAAKWINNLRDLLKTRQG